MTASDTAAGAAVYSPFFLRWVYDFWVLKISNNYAWRCPATQQRAFYSRNLASVREKAEPFRLLDIGVGTGYYLEHAPIPENTAVTLVDLNRNSIDAASQRLVAAHPQVASQGLTGDFLDPDPKSELAITRARLGGTKYNAISCMFLLHCVPGPPARKGEGLQRLAPLLEEGGVLFGTTILGKGVQHNLFGRFLMNSYNKVGSFDNWADDAESIVQPLRETFADVKFEVVGTVLLFEARNPKTGRPT